MSTPSKTSMSLLARAQGKEAQAWERLVELYGPLVYHWCRQSNLSGADTADVFQEVFQAVAVHLERFHRDRAGDTFRGWLRTIARNKIRDHFRNRAEEPPARGGSEAQHYFLHQPDPLPREDDSSEEDLTKKQLLQALEWIRGDFEARTWQAFWKVQIEEMETGIVAEELNMTPAAVRKARYRVLHRLREELKDLLF